MKAAGVAVGAAGCLVVAGLCALVGFGALYYFVNIGHRGEYEHLSAELNRNLLTDLYPKIEVYKLQHGSYPKSLSEFIKTLPKGSPAMIYDASMPKNAPKFREFYYLRVGCDHYYLRAAGIDRIPFTPDDDIPRVEPGMEAKLGLLMTRSPDRERACSEP